MPTHKRFTRFSKSVARAKRSKRYKQRGRMEHSKATELRYQVLFDEDYDGLVVPVTKGITRKHPHPYRMF